MTMIYTPLGVLGAIDTFIDDVIRSKNQLNKDNCFCDKEENSTIMEQYDARIAVLEKALAAMNTSMED